MIPAMIGDKSQISAGITPSPCQMVPGLGYFAEPEVIHGHPGYTAQGRCSRNVAQAFLRAVPQTSRSAGPVPVPMPRVQPLARDGCKHAERQHLTFKARG